MNSELIALTFKGLRRRWREVARVIAVVMISFMFVTNTQGCLMKIMRQILCQSCRMKMMIMKAVSGNWG